MRKKEILTKLINENKDVEDLLYSIVSLAKQDSYTKGDLMKLTLGEGQNIDASLPKEFIDDMSEWQVNPFSYVMDHTQRKYFGKPLNLHEKIWNQLMETIKKAEL